MTKLNSLFFFFSVDFINLSLLRNTTVLLIISEMSCSDKFSGLLSITKTLPVTGVLKITASA